MIKFILVSVLLLLDTLLCIYWGIVSLLYWKNCFPVDSDGNINPFILSNSLDSRI